MGVVTVKPAQGDGPCRERGRLVRSWPSQLVKSDDSAESPRWAELGRWNRFGRIRMGPGTSWELGADETLVKESGSAGIGLDPRDGEVLFANMVQGQIKRLKRFSTSAISR